MNKKVNLIRLNIIKNNYDININYFQFLIN